MGEFISFVTKFNIGKRTNAFTVKSVIYELCETVMS